MHQWNTFWVCVCVCICLNLKLMGFGIYLDSIEDAEHAFANLLITQQMSTHTPSRSTAIEFISIRITRDAEGNVLEKA